MRTSTIKAAFLDACICLEYPPLRDIDWRTLCGSDQVRLILTMPVLNALDKFKSDPRRQQRATRALAEIRSIWADGGKVRDGVSLESLSVEIRKDEFPTDFSTDSDDDHLLLLLVNYKRDHSPLDVLMATEDGGM